MDFFERQDHARRRTGLLVLGFSVAVLGVVAAVTLVAWTIARHFGSHGPAGFFDWLATPVGWGMAAGDVLVILGTSFFRWRQLAHGGGDRVAKLMGGRLVDPDTKHPQERVLINVVEEMAIASGLTVPNVYVLEREEGINAFAAGLHPANAVVAVTGGALDQFDRDELQGVVGHEFSHILNGDIRINLHLLALLAGITVIGELGASVWRGLFLDRSHARYHGGMSSSRSGRGGDARALLLLLGAGLALIVIGWIGVFAGRLIKAAVSRQREFLADAASVQFTRNPDGLAGALLKIAYGPQDSRLRARRAEEISHMAFGRAVGGAWRLTATHPPLAERMAALGPKYRLWFNQARRDQARAERERKPQRGYADTPAAMGTGMATASDAEDALHGALSATTLAALAGRVDPGGLDHARALLARIPGSVRHAQQTPEGATRTIYALMLHGPEHRDADRAALPESQREAVLNLRAALEADCGGNTRGTLDAATRLPLLELAMPALLRLPRAGREELLARVDDLIRADGRLHVFEYAARTLLHHELRPREGANAGTGRLRDARESVHTVLSLLTFAGSGDDADRAEAYQRALRPLFGTDCGQPLAREQTSLAAFSDALERLDGLPPMAKRALLTACADCVAADGVVRPAEAELLRVIAAVLNTPIPPLPQAG